MPRVIPGWPQPLFMRSIGMHRKFKETEGKLDLRLVSEKYPTDLFKIYRSLITCRPCRSVQHMVE